MTIKLFKVFLFSFFGIIPTAINAQGHYNGGSFNTNDYFIPPVSGWVFSLYYSYSDMNYYNGSHKKTDVIEISQNPPLSVELGQSVKTQSIIPMISYFGKKKMLKAKWGILALLMLNNPNANIALDFYSGQTLAGSKIISLKSFGLGDCYLQPIWLTWGKNKFSSTFSYGAWIPVGKHKLNDSGNIGLGYWSHNVRLMGRYKPKEKISVISGVTFELNNKQKGTDFIESLHLTVDYGGSYTFVKGHEIGLYGYGTWGIGSDRGEKASINNDQIYGLGVYGSYWFIPGKLGVLSRFTYNYGTKYRFGGASFQIGVNFLLFKI